MVNSYVLSVKASSGASDGVRAESPRPLVTAQQTTPASRSRSSAGTASESSSISAYASCADVHTPTPSSAASSSASSSMPDSATLARTASRCTAWMPGFIMPNSAPSEQ